jgi:hypothetical protein
VKLARELGLPFGSVLVKAPREAFVKVLGGSLREAQSVALGVAVEAPMEEVLLMGVALGVPGLTLASLADVLGLELWADSGLTAGFGRVMGELTAWWAGLRWVMTGEELTARWADITWEELTACWADMEELTVWWADTSLTTVL